MSKSEIVETTYEEFLCATDKLFVFEETTSAHIFSLLSKLCKSKATGLDNISAKLLREWPDLIAESLTYIFSQSLLTGIFPVEWKSARVTPLYKNSGNRNDPTNYRPISVIPVVAKTIWTGCVWPVIPLSYWKLYSFSLSIRISFSTLYGYCVTRGYG